MRRADLRREAPNTGSSTTCVPGGVGRGALACRYTDPSPMWRHALRPWAPNPRLAPSPCHVACGRRVPMTRRSRRRLGCCRPPAAPRFTHVHPQPTDSPPTKAHHNRYDEPHAAAGPLQRVPARRGGGFPARRARWMLQQVWLPSRRAAEAAHACHVVEHMPLPLLPDGIDHDKQAAHDNCGCALQHRGAGRAAHFLSQRAATAALQPVLQVHACCPCLRRRLPPSISPVQPAGPDRPWASTEARHWPPVPSTGRRSQRLLLKEATFAAAFTAQHSRSRQPSSRLTGRNDLQ